ncbi:OsmC family protein [Laribacter hongkongensis]|uniref:OsmC family protein n=1 Tax=Laribacter hongkongensis TaxID=168471 RepID=UPI001EFCE942|nr:OsmC family protein [Laribacter hongkongensis]MCG9106905.1 OsmC family protein [Laribacter hongkongensis]
MDNPTPLKVHLTQQDDYRFLVDFSASIPALLAGHAGDSSGPTPSQLLGAAAGQCLLASLVFALNKANRDAGQLSAEVICQPGRNPQGRQRIQSVAITARLGKRATDLPDIQPLLAGFLPFCTVPQSLVEGMALQVVIQDSEGLTLHCQA